MLKVGQEAGVNRKCKTLQIRLLTNRFLRSPGRVNVLGIILGNALLLAAIRIHRVNLPIAVPLRSEGDARPIR